MDSVTIRKQGNAVGIALPAETRIPMGLEIAQEPTLIELADGIKLVSAILHFSGKSNARAMCCVRGPTCRENSPSGEPTGDMG